MNKLNIPRFETHAVFSDESKDKTSSVSDQSAFGYFALGEFTPPVNHFPSSSSTYQDLTDTNVSQSRLKNVKASNDLTKSSILHSTVAKKQVSEPGLEVVAGPLGRHSSHSSSVNNVKSSVRFKSLPNMSDSSKSNASRLSESSTQTSQSSKLDLIGIPKPQSTITFAALDEVKTFEPEENQSNPNDRQSRGLWADLKSITNSTLDLVWSVIQLLREPRDDIAPSMLESGEARSGVDNDMLSYGHFINPEEAMLFPAQHQRSRTLGPK